LCAGGKKRLLTLIVEDNDAFRTTLKNLLYQCFPTLQFEEAKDGQETFAKILKMIFRTVQELRHQPL
jgi:CheY-like chemotaxis protein